MATASLHHPPSPVVRTPPTYGRFPLGVLPEFRRDPLGLYVGLMQQYRDLVRLRFGPRYSYTLFHPELIKRVLVDNNKNYQRNAFGNELLKQQIGLNLLTGDGDFWLHQRRLMQPAFHRQRIQGFGTIITTSAEAMLARWAATPPGAALNIAHEMMQVTLQVVGQALFSTDLLQDSRGLGHSIEVSSQFYAYRLGQLIRTPLWLSTRRNREYKAAIQPVLHLVPDMITARRQLIANQGTADETGRQYDMLDLLLDARDEETGAAMSDEQLATEIRMFIAAGHETTSNTLTWTLYLLSQHPEVEAKLLAEIDGVLNGRTPTVAALPQLVYTKMVIDEAMRLYPAAWIIARQAIGEDQLGDYHIPPKQGAVIPIFAVHRHPDFWVEPDRFDPERFTPVAATQQHRFAFLPFGGGPRQCIGAGFAQTEAQLILPMILQRYRLRLQPGSAVVPEPLVTLRVKGGLPMTLAPRMS
jgi:cytochrome P450